MFLAGLAGDIVNYLHDRIWNPINKEVSETGYLFVQHVLSPCSLFLEYMHSWASCDIVNLLLDTKPFTSRSVRDRELLLAQDAISP